MTLLLTFYRRLYSLEFHKNANRFLFRLSSLGKLQARKNNNKNFMRREQENKRVSRSNDKKVSNVTWRDVT